MKVTSVTGLLEESRTLELLNANFVNPVKLTGAKLLIEPPKGQRLDFTGIGTAYDYWVRSQLVPIDKDLIASFLGFQICVDGHGDEKRTSKVLKRHVDAILASSSGNSESQEGLLKACLFLAKFEIEYRSSYPVESLEIAAHNVVELGRLASGTDLDRFKRPNLILHPMFCTEGSKLKIQADGDIVVDNVLIDLKTSQRIELKDNLRQLILYWTLNDLAYTDRRIDRLGVYYPRFNYSVDFSPSDLMSSSQYATIKTFISSKLGKRIRACRSN
jgi:hypothetical protein